jgi:DNA-binding ferritin-like protein
VPRGGPRAVELETLITNGEKPMTQTVAINVSDNLSSLGSQVVTEISSAPRQLPPQKMLMGLRHDHTHLTVFLREAHEICGKYNDIESTSLIEVWIDQIERRTRFLSEIVSDL